MSNITIMDLRRARVPAAGGGRTSITRRVARVVALTAAGAAVLGILVALRLGLYGMGHPQLPYFGEMLRAFQ